MNHDSQFSILDAGNNDAMTKFFARIVPSQMHLWNMLLRFRYEEGLSRIQWKRQPSHFSIYQFRIILIVLYYVIPALTIPSIASFGSLYGIVLNF